MIFVGEVPNGKACGCFCPKYGEPLIARNNVKNIREAHFQHHREYECKGAVESALHKLAKQVFKDTMTLRLPEAFWNVKFLFHC